jgi:hypothetical protein
MATMLVVTGITNFCMFPAIYQLYQKELVFEVRAHSLVASLWQRWLKTRHSHELPRFGAFVTGVYRYVHDGYQLPLPLL